MAEAPGLLGCWYSEIGAVNQILIVQDVPDAGATVAARLAALTSTNPFGIGELIIGMAMDAYASLDFMKPMRPGEFGLWYEVRTYTLKPDGLPPTIKLWR